MRLVDADAMTEMVRKAVRTSESPWTHYAYVQKMINDAPTVEPKKGKWRNYNGSTLMFCCTSCEDYITNAKSNFCPNCGAKMEVGK